MVMESPPFPRADPVHLHVGRARRRRARLRASAGPVRASEKAPLRQSASPCGPLSHNHQPLVRSLALARGNPGHWSACSSSRDRTRSMRAPASSVSVWGLVGSAGRPSAAARRPPPSAQFGPASLLLSVSFLPLP